MVSETLGLFEVAKFAESFCLGLVPGEWLFLKGQIGAGKTTFMRFLMGGEQESAQEISSPTFSILNTYDPPVQLRNRFDLVLHLDLYRVETLSELLYLGLDLTVTEKSLLVFEWPDRFPREEWVSFLNQSGVPAPKSITELSITVNEANHELRDYKISSLQSMNFPI